MALHCTFYNFVRIHKTLRVTPAMAARVATRLWEMKDIVALVENAEAAVSPNVRGPYKPRVAKVAISNWGTTQHGDNTALAVVVGPHDQDGKLGGDDDDQRPEDQRQDAQDIPRRRRPPAWMACLRA